jgi:serine/threonine protein kinase
LDKKQELWVLNELRMLSIISEPQNTHCSKIENIFEGKDNIYVVNELIGGQELLEWIVEHRRTMNEMDALTAMYSILKGMMWLESKGITHRDLKPSNILLRNPQDLSDLVIVDFGLALIQSDIDNLKTNNLPSCVGTPGYIAPEILHGDHFTPKADIFSLGSLLFLMMTGMPLFHAENQDQVLENNREFNFYMVGYRQLTIEYFHRESVDLLRGMVNTDPIKRWSATECFNCAALEYFREKDKEMNSLNQTRELEVP